MIEAHDLAHEFPEHKTRIHDLKMSSGHFARLFERYHALDRDIHRMEVGAEVACDDRLNLLKAERVQLKDELYAMLQAAS